MLGHGRHRMTAVLNADCHVDKLLHVLMPMQDHEPSCDGAGAAHARAMAHAARVGRAAQPTAEVDVNNIACLLDIKLAMRLCSSESMDVLMWSLLLTPVRPLTPNN